MKSMLRPRARFKVETDDAAAAPRLPLGLRALLMGAFVLATALLLTLPVRAALVLEYFNVIPSSSAVLLEWSTASEYNVAGFELYLKGVDEARSAYRRLAFLNAKGGPDQGALYDLLVTDLRAGQAYCFRLEEVTSDETPGEARERCGYGLGIGPTPVPSPTATLSTTVGMTPTVVLFPTQPIGFDGMVPTATIPGAFATNTPDPYAQPQQPQSPLETPTPTWTVDPLALGASQTLDPALAGQFPTFDPLIDGTPTPDPAFTGQFPTADPLAQAQQPQSLLETPTPTWTVDPAFGNNLPIDPTSFPPQPLPDQLVPTATSLYIVVTAAATPEPQGIAPGLTPWPTATPPTNLLLGNLLAPSAQNLTVLLLCFIFLSATGLGALGLLTSVVYMRSRAQREYDDMRVRSRRRLL